MKISSKVIQSFMVLVFVVVSFSFAPLQVQAKKTQDTQIIYAQTFQATCIRKYANTTSTCLKVLPKYVYIRVYSGTMSKFIYVKYQSYTGWVLRNYVVLIYN